MRVLLAEWFESGDDDDVITRGGEGRVVLCRVKNRLALRYDLHETPLTNLPLHPPPPSDNLRADSSCSCPQVAPAGGGSWKYQVSDCGEVNWTR